VSIPASVTFPHQEYLNYAVNAANATAQAAQAVAAAATASAFKPATPPRFENKDKDLEICKWLSIVEDYARTCADGIICVLSALFCTASRVRIFSRNMTLTRLLTETPSLQILERSSVRPWSVDMASLTRPRFIGITGTIPFVARVFRDQARGCDLNAAASASVLVAFTVRQVWGRFTTR
jgi:hypothetical protein